MFIIFFRVVILYILLLVVIRLMGKRQLGELQPFELVITILIAELAASPIENSDIPLMNGIVSILTLFILEGIFSTLMLKSERARSIIDGTPSIVMDRGKLLYDEMKKQRININDLLEHLRIAGYHNLHELEYIIIEPDGQLSIILKTPYRPITIKDMNLDIKDGNGIPINLIADGIRNKRNMLRAKCDDRWLDSQLKAKGYRSDKEILLAYLDSQGNLHIQEKEKRKG